MANELHAHDATGKTLYAVLINSIGQVRNTSGTPAFEAYNGANWTDYDMALTEAGAGIYLATMPAVAAGMYSYAVYERAGASPAVTDTLRGVGNIAWSGTAEIVPLAATVAGRALVVDANGLADANAVKVGPSGSGTAQTAGDVMGVLAHADYGNAKLVRSTTPANTLTVDASHRALSDLASILGTALTETTGQIAAAFKKFFNVATPTGTVNSIPDAVPGTANGLPILDANGDVTGVKLAATQPAVMFSEGLSIYSGDSDPALAIVNGNVPGGVGLRVSGYPAVSIATDEENADFDAISITGQVAIAADVDAGGALHIYNASATGYGVYNSGVVVGLYNVSDTTGMLNEGTYGTGMKSEGLVDNVLPSTVLLDETQGAVTFGQVQIIADVVGSALQILNTNVAGSGLDVSGGTHDIGGNILGSISSVTNGVTLDETQGAVTFGQVKIAANVAGEGALNIVNSHVTGIGLNNVGNAIGQRNYSLNTGVENYGIYGQLNRGESIGQINYGDATGQQNRGISTFGTENIGAAADISPAPPTVAEIDAQLSGTHGASTWGATGAGSGSGTYTDTITDGTNPLDGARVILFSDAAMTDARYQAYTNASGVFTMYPDSGTYYRKIEKAGYTFVQAVEVTVT